MKKFQRLAVTIFAFVAFFGFSIHAHAANQYYVDSSNCPSTGNCANAGNGTLSSPWVNASQAASANLQPGDVVSFKKGQTYKSGMITINRSGTASAPITFNSYGSGTAPAFIGNGSTLQNIFYFPPSTAYVVFDGFYFTDPTLNPNDPEHAEMAKNQRVFSVEGNHITLKNSIIELSGAPVVFSGNYNTLDNTEIKNLRMVVNTCASFTNGVCTQYPANGDDKDYGANPITLQDGSSNNTITNNTFSGCWAKSYDYGYDGGAIEFYGAGSNNIFAYNTVSDCIGLAEVTGSSSNNVFAYNKFINIGSLFFFQSSGSPTYSNWQFYNNNVVDTTGNRVPENQMISGTTQQGTLTLKNNVFKLSSGVDVTNSSTGSKFVHSNNLFQLSNNSVANITLNSTEINASSGAAIFNSTTAADPVNWNYIPASGSPLIDAGTNVGYNKDLNGTTVPLGNAPDIGVYEAGSTTGGGGDNFPPTVLFTTPVSGSTVIGIIPVTVSASDNTGVVGVQFTLDGAALGTEDTVFPYSATWNTAVSTNGAHTLTATARDAAGNTAMATSFVTVNNPPTGDGIAPTVSFSSPAAGSTVSGTTTVSASATDNVAVANVKFTLDGILHTTDTTAPYSASWISPGVPDGSHTWTVVATDTSGNVSSTATRSFTVSNTVTSNPTAPTGLTATAVSTSQVALSWNSSGAVYGYEIYRNGVDIGHTTGSGTTYTDTGLSANTTYTYNVSAIYPCDCNETPQSNTATVTTTITTANPTVPTGLTGTNVGTQVSVTWVPSTGTVTGYRVYRNGVLVGQVATTSFSETVAASGTYTYTVAAYNAGFESAQSVPLVISIGSSAPVVSMTSPVSGSTISGIIAVSANATDANGIASVTFKVDGSQIGSVDTIAPYTVSLDTATILNGSHVISATAVDTTGLSTTANATVTVTNTAAASYKLTARVNVRLNPTTGSTGTVLGQQNKGAIGTVVGGPVSKNGYIWYKLDFPTGVDGWVVSKYMTVYSTARTANPPLVGTTESTTTVVLDDTQSRAMTLLQQAASAPTTAEANRLIAEARLLISR